MPLMDFNWNPTNRQLRQFGGISLLILPLLTWFWGGDWNAVGIAAGVGAALLVLSFAIPRTVKPVFVGLSLLLLPIGLVVGELLMLTVFLVAFAPMGILFRLIGRDRLQLKLDRRAETYWENRPAPADLRRYFRQY